MYYLFVNILFYEVFKLKNIYFYKEKYKFKFLLSAQGKSNTRIWLTLMEGVVRQSLGIGWLILSFS